MKRSINKVPSKLLTARCVAIPNRMQVHELPRWRCRSINPSHRSGFFVAICSAGRLLRTMIWVQFLGSIEKRTKLTSAHVSRQKFSVCIMKVMFSCKMQCLYVCLAKKAFLKASNGKDSGSYSDTVAS